MPRGVLYTYLKCRVAIGVSIHFMEVLGIEVVLYISAWVLALLVSDIRAYQSL